MAELESTKNQHFNSWTNFEPRTEGRGVLFFCPQSFYLCLRFFYTLYERLLKAYEFSWLIEDKAKALHNFTDDQVA